MHRFVRIFRLLEWQYQVKAGQTCQFFLFKELAEAYTNVNSTNYLIFHFRTFGILGIIKIISTNPESVYLEDLLGLNFRQCLQLGVKL